MTTAIITDSTTSLAPGVLERPDFRMVPLTFHFHPDESYRDKIDMSNAEFYDRLYAADEFPTTSQPAPGTFVEAFEALEAYDHILVLTLSSKVSGTYDSAVSAAGIVERPVEVLDTRSAEMGSGLILLEALRVVDEGGDFKDVRRAAEAAIDRCNMLFGVGTLEYLAKSGRIGRARRLMGAALNIRPVLSIEDGEVVPHKRTRGRRRQMAAIVEEVRPAAEAGRPLYFGHIAAPELLSELAESLGVEEKLVAEIGGVVGSHVGPGAYGVAHL
jgi:DegV family protein with EDD domain